MKNYNYCIYLILILTLVFSYSCEKKNNVTTLHFSQELSMIKDSSIRIPMEKMEITNYKDSVRINRVFPERTFNNTYLKLNNKVYDLVVFNDIPDIMISGKEKLDTILFLSQQDTIYEWENIIRFFLLGLNRTGSIVKIEKLSPNEFKTTLQSKWDSLYKETYYYDSLYNITQFSYEYRNDKVVLK